MGLDVDDIMSFLQTAWPCDLPPRTVLKATSAMYMRSSRLNPNASSLDQWIGEFVRGGGGLVGRVHCCEAAAERPGQLWIVRPT